MAKKEIKDDLKFEDFPEKITEDGIRIYGETSYENQKEEIILASHSFPLFQ